ncbi:MAG TPA: dihydrolipoamide acetyltransferase family protein [Chloroflexota bacterium]|nr:dihydrolipoamide acetyltransferase family protein [Chloroflexota bacterium]
MPVEFRLPDLGEGIAEAEMLRWLVKPGDRVVLDQAIAEVQTDKAVVELPAPVAGTILSLNATEGQVMPVGTLLVTIDDGRQEAPASAAAVQEERSAQAAMGSTALQAEPAGANGGRWTAVSVAPQRRALATPAVRRLARELGLDIASVRGSGPAGRVLAEDLRAAAAPPVEEAPPPVEVAAPAGSAAPRPAPSVPLALPGEEEGPAEERLPLRGLRRRIAENMVLSVTTIPQITSLVEVEASALVALRQSLLSAAEARGLKLSYLPFVIKALVQALRAYPYINATIDDSSKEIVLKRHYHIGIATATPDGLLVPVLHHADRLTILQIAAELNRLAEAGRERKLALDELRGSTFTITNFGSAGGYFATPIINPGEAAILGLGRIAKRPWVVEDRVEPRPILPISFTADHRLIDGELALRFLNTLIASLENPNLIMLDMR